MISYRFHFFNIWIENFELHNFADDNTISWTAKYPEAN